ncbi:regulatory protein, luxR family [Ruaniaceae bacterium KH17]|nr:regulatory protein, luxR family [Ruaniaceae bacterium KH17]
MSETRQDDTSVDPLSAFARRLESTVAAGDIAAAATLITNHLPETWYGLPLTRVSELLQQINSSNSLDPMISSIAAFLAGQDPAVATGRGTTPALSSAWARTVQTLQLRTRGATHELQERLHEKPGILVTIEPLFDPNGSMHLMMTVQLGITAMLAGEYNLALTYFGAAQLQRLVPTVPFLTRDAYLKSAIIHASLGDTRDAQRALDQARDIPRTHSWAEPLIDSNEVIARALISPCDATADEMLAVPFHNLGEIWPFYMTALIRLVSHLGRRHDVENLLLRMEQMPFPHTPGEGLPGSIIPISRSMRNIDRGDMTAAKRLINDADPADPFTQQCMIVVELNAGRLRATQRAARALEKNPWVTGLRRAELWSLVGLAESYIGLNSPDKALEALRSMDALPGGMRPADLRQLGPRTRLLASSEFPCWLVDDVEPLTSGGSAGSPVNLTEREYETLRVLAKEITRAEMAAELFISVNTLKGHLRSIYKKMGVTNREAALLRARREGWL